MAYDPNDPKDKAIVQGLIDTALEQARETHEAEIEGLKTKNTDLIGKLRKARAEGGNENTGEIERLETELNEAQGKLRKAESDLRQVNRDVATVTAERDAAQTSLQAETDFARNLLVNNGLTGALVEANVAPQFLDDVTASLARQVTIKDSDGERKAFVGDKPLGEFVKEWSQSDRGKHYVVAPANGGGGTPPPGSPQGGAKKLYEMTEPERIAAHNANPADFQARVAAGENKVPPKS